MKKICSDPDIDVCRALKKTLDANDIPCVLKNESHEPTLGGRKDSLLGSLHPELWILDDAHVERALQILYPGDDSHPGADDTATDDAE